MTLYPLTLRPLSYLRALEVSPADLALVTAILYRFILSSKVCSMLPGTEETLVSCEEKKKKIIYEVAYYFLHKSLVPFKKNTAYNDGDV